MKMSEASPVIDPAVLETVVEAIRPAATLSLGCHVGPDGDALGSMLGFALAAVRQQKTVHSSFGEPFSVPDQYRFLPVDLLCPPADVPDTAEVFVSFDAGSLDRLGALAPRAKAAGTLVVIDHHASNEGFGDLNLIDADASATAEMVVHLLDALGWEIDSEIATCLHTGIVTDTGRFQYSNTSPHTLVTAARLVGLGARPEIVGRHVYEETPFGYLHVAGAVLSRARLEPERRLVWSVLETGDLAEAGINLDDTDLLIDAIRVAREAEVALLIKELEGERLKLSFRSRGLIDVGAIAVALGGGGHHNAAGCTLSGEVGDAIDRVRRLLDDGEGSHDG